MSCLTIENLIDGHVAWLREPDNGRRADFKGRDLRGYVFEGKNLRLARFSGANCGGAWFGRCDLTSANFVGVDASFAEFTNITACEANFTDANLEGADFTDASLTRVLFKDTDISCTIFDRADLRDCDLSVANLEKIRKDFFSSHSECDSDEFLKAVVSLRKDVIAGSLDGPSRYLNRKMSYMDILSPQEMLIRAIRIGDTPRNSEVAAITVALIDVFLAS